MGGPSTRVFTLEVLMFRRFVSAVAVLLAVLFTAAPAQAVPDCPTEEHRAELSAFEERLRSADDVAEAKELALSRVDRTRKAVDRAASIVPGDDQLLEHQAQLDDFAHDIETATTQHEVADSFGALGQQRVGERCDYSTGEIVAIVIGFILGVIPGIIMLIVFC